MREFTLKRWLLAASVGLLMPCAADAAGLGRLTILSGLGQPLSAEVELASVQKGETLTARLSSVETYQQANLPFNAALTSARVTIEKRPNGTPYLKVTTLRPVNEPFAELLIEINSENGKVTRQYTVLLDPPGYGRSAAELPPPTIAAPAVRTPPSTPTQGAAAPAAAAPGAPPDAGAPGPAAAPARAPARQPAARAAAPAAEPSAGAKQYGPVKQGETLGRIARSVKPEGVSLEQTLVSLYRQNPDAFIKKNMNLVKSGRILTVPEANEMAAIAQPEAVKEIRLQVADFNSFRDRLADRVANAPEDGSVTSGRIGARVAKADAAEPRDTVRLSRADSSGKAGAKGAAADRVRALEEEAVAREKALADASARIAQLEKTIKDMQRLAEMKGAPQPADKGASPQPAPGAKGQTSGPIAVAPVIAPPPAKAPGTAAPGTAPDTPKGAGPDAGKGAPPAAAKGGPADTAKGPAPDAARDAAPQPKGAPGTAQKAKPPAPAPAPQPDLIDTVMEEPLYLAAAGAVLVLVILGVVASRRRRGGAGAGPTKIAPTLGGGGSTPSDGATLTPGKPDRSKAGAGLAVAPAARAPQEPVRAAPARAPAPASSPAPSAAAAAPAAAAIPGATDNDLDFNAGERTATPGRAEPPKRVEPAARPAAPRVEPLKAAEPTPRAAPPKAAAPPPRPAPAPAPVPKPAPAPRAEAPAARAEAPPLARPSTTGLGAARSLEGTLGAARTSETAPAVTPKAAPAPSAPALPEFELEVPSAGTGDAKRHTAASDFNMDFNLEPLPPIEIPGESKAAQAKPAEAKPAAVASADAPTEIRPAAAPADAKPAAAAASPPDLDFKLDDINLDFGGSTPTRQAAKDDHWYDVQQKFDLAKAYEEMGDKDGARDILQEVVKEGDADQQSQARKLLGALS
ncbi:MAG: hypothetical protein JWO70_3264 [Betaproteobacteria bacterium]|nr:hypothetical protein [Betaproteobacteria bacterium]